MRVTQIRRGGVVVGRVSLGSGGGGGQVPTSGGSNTWSWGSNVATVIVDNTTVVLGPNVNFAAGSNVTLSVSSNTVTIHAPGGGGSNRRPLMAYDPGISNYLVVVDGDGTAVMVEDP